MGPPTSRFDGISAYLGGDVEAFCDEVVREAGVLLLPGSVYDDSTITSASGWEGRIFRRR